MIPYILPSEPGKPPRALLMFPLDEEIPEAIEEQVMAQLTDEDKAAVESNAELHVAAAIQVIFSPDMGCWVSEDGITRVPEDLANLLTECAKELGVPWD